MIERLSIRNFALIENIQLVFDKGFNVLTGETGAGKSIIIDALNLVLGEKASSDSVRKGADRAFVEAVFDLNKKEDIKKNLSLLDIPCEEDILIIRREIFADGKSRIFVNDRMVTLSRLREIGNLLVDIHGQHEHQSLLNVETHLKIIDIFGNLEDEAKLYRDCYDRYFSLLRKREQIKMNEREKERMIDMLSFAIKEIEEIDPKTGEDEELEIEIKRMAHLEKIFSAADEVYRLIYQDEDSAMTRLKKSEDILDKILEYDPSISEIRERLTSAIVNSEDVASFLRDYRESYSYSQEELDSKMERLEKIKRLKKKYGQDIQSVIEYKEKAKIDLMNLQNSEEEEKKIEEELLKTGKELVSQADRLSGRRRVVAKLLEEKVNKELSLLAMKEAKFEVNFFSQEDENEGFLFEKENKKIRLTKYGRDQVEFLICTNPGENMKPLRKIISGGELSRVMLALKSVLSFADFISTMVFDEIDAGISGETALVVGRKIKSLAENKQIICITHLPQIAAKADKHFSVRKKIREDGRTVTEVYILNDKEREKELARMLKGDLLTEAAIVSARELMNDH